MKLLLRGGRERGIGRRIARGSLGLVDGFGGGELFGRRLRRKRARMLVDFAYSCSLYPLLHITHSFLFSFAHSFFLIYSLQVEKKVLGVGGVVR